MVDVDGILTTEEGLRQLSKKTKENSFEELKNAVPRKKTGNSKRLGIRKIF